MLKNNLLKIKNGKFENRYFIITKALGSYYKNPDSLNTKF